MYNHLEARAARRLPGCWGCTDVLLLTEAEPGHIIGGHHQPRTASDPASEHPPPARDQPNIWHHAAIRDSNTSTEDFVKVQNCFPYFNSNNLNLISDLDICNCSFPSSSHPSVIYCSDDWVNLCFLEKIWISGNYYYFSPMNNIIDTIQLYHSIDIFINVDWQDIIDRSKSE